MADSKAATAAAEMRAAAALLRERVQEFRSEAATSPYWRGFAEYAHGVDNAMGGAGGRLAMLFTPDLAAQLGSWLKQTARRWDRETRTQGRREYHEECDGFLDEDCVCFDPPLALARIINGAVS